MMVMAVVQTPVCRGMQPRILAAVQTPVCQDMQLLYLMKLEEKECKMKCLGPCLMMKSCAGKVRYFCL